jgi:hypothetical protein
MSPAAGTNAGAAADSAREATQKQLQQSAGCVMVSYAWNQLMRDADAAPSILNTKPWLFREVPNDDRIELLANWGRHLKVIDPMHRELLISCGAALFNLRMAIRVSGHDPVVWLLPDKQTQGVAPCPHCGHGCGLGDLLASVEIVVHRPHPPTRQEQRLYEAILQRHTVRQPFSHRIEMNMVAELWQAAWSEGVHARLLHRKEVRRLLRWTARVDDKLKLDQSYLAELHQWTGSSCPPGLGVRATEFGPEPKNHRHSPVRDFGLTSPGPRPVTKFEKHPQLVALETPTDTPLDWLRVGQALQRLLLTATYYGVEASFLTQQLEAEDSTIPAYQSAHLWPWPRSAQMVVRVGAP